MRKMISEIMGDALQDDDRKRYDFLPPDLPVKATSNEWVLSNCKRKLQRKFQFPNINSRNAFIIDIIQLEVSAGHNIDFKVIDSDVTVILQTKDLGMITELDVECSKHLSACAVDVLEAAL